MDDKPWLSYEYFRDWPNLLKELTQKGIECNYINI